MKITKNIITILPLIVLLLSLNCKECEAQQGANEIVASANLGYSTMKILLTVNLIDNPYFSSNAGWYPSGNELPVGDISLDYGINDRYSIGVGIAYQEIASNPETISRLNIGFRLLDHFGKGRNTQNGKLDEYIGLRPGVSFWEDRSYFNSMPTLFKPSFILPSIQFLIGIRLYLLHHLALQVEAGVGTPYFINVGLSYRINKHKTSQYQDATDGMK